MWIPVVVLTVVVLASLGVIIYVGWKRLIKSINGSSEY